MDKKWFVLAGLLLILSMALGACGPAAPAAQPAPEIVKETVEVEVEKVVKETVPVEVTVVVEATPVPEPTTVLSAAASGVMTISKEQFSSWTRNFNPLLPDQQQRFPTRAGIYEPMLIYNVMTGEFVPWLASEWSWSDDSMKLTFTARENVQWSDGQPFTAADVAFTFNLMKEVPAFDNFSVWSYLTEVKAVDEQHVEFSFAQPYIPSLPDIGQQPIVAEHIWKDIENPAEWTNENPVGTGPFTEVRVFQNQVYELGRNPNYWQEGKPYIDALRFPAFTSNEQAQLALYNGEVDWAGNMIPDAENTYAAADPDNHYWFPPVGGPVFLYLNTTRAPFDDPNVRKAVSMALDRDKIVEIAMFDYIRPADATGMGENANVWKDSDLVAGGTWTQMNVEEANRLLDEAGLERGSDGIRLLPDGTKMQYDLHVVTGWTDWVATCEIMSRNLKEVGIEAPVKTSDFGAWLDILQAGNFDMSIGWSSALPFPYNIYREKMSCDTVRPIGEIANENWQRYCNQEADELLTRLAAATDPQEQEEIVYGLQKIFIDEAPAIPLFPGPSWGEYNTKRFTNWPNGDNPYAKLTPNDPPGFLLVLTNVKPK